MTKLCQVMVHLYVYLFNEDTNHARYIVVVAFYTCHPHVPY